MRVSGARSYLRRKGGGRPRLSRLVVGVLAMALAVVGLSVAATVPASAAPPPPNNLEDVQAVTYNMQGAGSGRDVNKWTKDLPQLLRGG